MAIDYDGPTGLFTRLGKLMHAFETFEANQLTGTDTIPDLRDQVLALFPENPELVDGLFGQFENLRGGVDAWKSMLVGFMETQLEALADELDAPSKDLSTIWPLFLARMTADGETVDANAVALGEIIPSAANTGDGQLVVEISDVDGRLIETLAQEALRVECVSSPSADSESFRISGEVPPASRMSAERGGTGSGDTIGIANGSDNLLTNSDFEDFTDDAPDDWDVDAGVATDNILALTASPFRGDKSLKFLGDGVAAAITISQPFQEGRIAPKSKYACGCWIKTSGLTAATFTLQLSGTGYSAGAQKISIGAGSYPADWTFYAFFIDTPAIIPADFKIEISATAVEDNGVVLVDGLALVLAANHHGLSWAVFGGAQRFAEGDAWTFNITNDLGGNFQTMFGRLWDIQLPSDAADGETISDDLIEGMPG